MPTVIIYGDNNHVSWNSDKKKIKDALCVSDIVDNTTCPRHIINRICEFVYINIIILRI